jgi:hypothetical protein
VNQPVLAFGQDHGEKSWCVVLSGWLFTSFAALVKVHFLNNLANISTVLTRPFARS